MHIELSRVQFEERDLRRQELLLALASDKSSRECMERVRARMRHGDKVWIPPLTNIEKRRAEWEARTVDVDLSAHVLPMRPKR